MNDPFDAVAEVLSGSARYAVICGDAFEVLKRLPSGVAHVCYCDPPYGMSEQTTEDVVACLSTWLAGKVYTHSGKGFMGAEWDAFVPGPEVWREVLRVVKPGAYVAAFSSMRTMDLLGMSMRLAGLEARPSWAWVQGQGFPKSLNVGKAIDKAAGAEREVVGQGKAGAAFHYGNPGDGGFGNTSELRGEPSKVWDVTAPATEQARMWDGRGTAVKPAVEPVLVFRRTLDGTVVNNVLAHGCGALNIDGARVATSDNLNGGTYSTSSGRDRGANRPGDTRSETAAGSFARKAAVEFEQPSGRFPADIAFVHDEECECIGKVKVNGDSRTGGGTLPGGFVNTGAERGDSTPCVPGYGDTDGTETVDDWRCTPTCPVAELARQSGTSTTPDSVVRGAGGKHGRYGPLGAQGEIPSYGDSGTASRFFYNAKASAADRLVFVRCSESCVHHDTVCGVREARASARDATREHPHGFCVACGAERDHYQHPTVKPLDLALYHARLLSLPASVSPIAVVPFCGTGIEAAALLAVGFRVIAVDIDPRHVAMTEHRLSRMRVQGVRPERNTQEELPLLAHGSAIQQRDPSPPRQLALFDTGDGEK